MAKINGRVVELKFGGVRVCGGQSISLNVDVDLPDATTQCSEDGWEEQIHGVRSWSADWSGLHDKDYTYNIDAVIGAILKETALALTVEVGAKTFTGSCLVGPCSISAPMESPMTASFNVVGNGALTLT